MYLVVLFRGDIYNILAPVVPWYFVFMVNSFADLVKPSISAETVVEKCPLLAVMLMLEHLITVLVDAKWNGIG
jgi:hypothetical protein